MTLSIDHHVETVICRMMVGVCGITDKSRVWLQGGMGWEVQGQGGGSYRWCSEWGEGIWKGDMEWECKLAGGELNSKWK